MQNEVFRMREEMKALIADTFTEMLEKEDLDKITVTKLIEECQISRQTFYYHYRDILDVLEWAFGQAAQNLAKQSMEAENEVDAVQIYLNFVRDNKIKLEKLRDSKRWVQIERILIESVMKYLRQMAQSKTPGIEISVDDAEMLLCFYAYGMTGVLLQYAGRKIDEKKLAYQLERIITGKLSLAQYQ